MVTEPFGEVQGKYLTRIKAHGHGPLPEGELLQATSDDLLARMSLLSLAEEMTNTDHNTEIERRRLLHDMDLVVRYNRKLIAIFQDIIDHIGPDTAAPPTEWDFLGAQQYLTNKKIEFEKWERIAAVKSGAKEREDLFTYYGAVTQHIHNTARDIAHEAQYTMQQLEAFVKTVQGADQDLISTWFEDAVGPSCRQYVADLKQKEQQIANLMRAMEKVKVYKTLMTYKNTTAQTLFDDDIYHEIVKLNREIEGLKDGVSHKERKIEVAKRTTELVKQQVNDTDKSSDKFITQAQALEVYMASIKRNTEAEKETANRIQRQTVELEREVRRKFLWCFYEQWIFFGKFLKDVSSST